LRVFGEHLDPDEVSKLLGAQPTHSYRKGDVRYVQKTTGKQTIAKHGGWLLDLGHREPENLNEQIAAILGTVTSDLAMWQKLTSEFDVDLFCGLFMASGNDGFILSPETMSALGMRGVELQFDVYHFTDE
jgi:hypothetical protein